MALFKYRARHKKTEKEEAGLIEAFNESHARQQLAERGFEVELVEKAVADAAVAWRPPPRPAPVAAKRPRRRWPFFVVGLLALVALALGLRGLSAPSCPLPSYPGARPDDSRRGEEVLRGQLVRYWTFESADPFEKVAAFYTPLLAGAEWSGGRVPGRPEACWTRGPAWLDGTGRVLPLAPDVALIWLYPASGGTAIRLVASSAPSRVALPGKPAPVTLPPALLKALEQPASARELDLSGCHLAFLPPELERLSGLQKLVLSRNQLKSLDGIGSLKSLERLEASVNALPGLPAEIGELKSLKVLRLEENQLTSLPPELAQLQGLEELHCGSASLSNHLDPIPPAVFELKNLRILTLGGNNLVALPEDIGKLTNLKVLGLQKNGLTTLPAALQKLTRLETLYLSDNPLPPAELAKVPAGILPSPDSRLPSQ